MVNVGNFCDGRIKRTTLGKDCVFFSVNLWLCVIIAMKNRWELHENRFVFRHIDSALFFFALFWFFSLSSFLLDTHIHFISFGDFNLMSARRWAWKLRKRSTQIYTRKCSPKQHTIHCIDYIFLYYWLVSMGS